MMEKIVPSNHEGGGDYVLCLPAKGTLSFEPTQKYGIDGVTESLRLFRAKELRDFKDIVTKYLGNLMEKNGSGVLCLLYSCLLTRGLDK